MVWSNDSGQVNKGKGYKVVNWLDWPAAIWDVDGAYPGPDCGYTQQPLLLVLRLIRIFNRAAKYVVYSGPRLKQGLRAGHYSFNHGGDLSFTDRLPTYLLRSLALINLSTINFRLRHRLVSCPWSLW